ncbi:MAG: hypothetical protein WBL70_12555 [Candidatus Acidiferrales bacterium]
MPEKRVKIPFAGVPEGTADGHEVPILESTERWSEVRLEDGTAIRVKPNVISAVRIDGQFDQDGNPTYALRTSMTMAVISSPERLHKGSTEKVQ